MKNDDIISKKLKLKVPLSEYTEEEQQLLSKIYSIEESCRKARSERRIEILQGVFYGGMLSIMFVMIIILIKELL